MAAPRRWLTMRTVEQGLALLFLGAGAIKLAGLPAMVRLFDAMGMGQWLRFAVGAAEMTGGAMLLVPGLTLPGVLLLVGVMFGAIGGDVMVLHTLPLAPVAVLAVLLAALHARRGELRALVRGPIPFLRRGRHA